MKCIICQNDSLENFIEEIKVLKCKKCELVFDNSNNIKPYPKISHQNKILVKIQLKFSQILAEQYMKYLKKHHNINNFKRVLDIGCGFGSFVKLINNKNCQAYGIESNEDTIIQGKLKHLKHITFDETFKEKKFDLVCLHQSLYYFQDSLMILEKVRTILNEGGLVFIANPNMSSKIRNDHLVWPTGSKMCLSKINFKELKGLKLIDYTAYTDQFYKEYLLTKKIKKSKTILGIKSILYLLKIKKLVKYTENGMNNFILLKKYT